MIIRRRIDSPELWRFILNKLPDSLDGQRIDEGYGEINGIKVEERKRSFWDFNRPLIATVENNKIVIYQPQYFSDFEKLGLMYEKLFLKEITIEVWEKP